MHSNQKNLRINFQKYRLYSYIDITTFVTKLAQN